MGDIETALNSLSVGFVEDLYADFLHDPDSVPKPWRRYFESLGDGDGVFPTSEFKPSFKPRSIFNPAGGGNGRAARKVAAEERPPLDAANLQDRVDQLIRNYRVRGHRMAQIDPLGLPRSHPPELDPAYYGFTEADMDAPVSSETIPSTHPLTLREVIDRMTSTYCRSIGAQFMHIDNLSVRQWLQERMESTGNRLSISRDLQLRILTRLTDAVIFEEFIQKKFVGAKSFSLEGAESLIPLLELAIEEVAEHGVDEIVMGMAHRGRLNVLANIMGKRPREIFREFEDKEPSLHLGRGDVKYHLGYHTEWTTSADRKVHLALCFNPSHLEFVNPVALGRMRARQDRERDMNREKGMVLLIHGDAAFAGEGMIQETLNLSELDAYTVGGTIHVILNNQIGFTTNPYDARSTTYASDVAKMLQSPIFHVNGEDPEAVAQVVNLAVEFRSTFKRDVVIDMYCYRRRGHNEGDEPSFTQPRMYRAIRAKSSVRDSYLEHLLELDEVTREEADDIADARRKALEIDLEEAREIEEVRPPSVLRGVWSGYLGGTEKGVAEVDTGIPRERASQLLKALTRLPDDFRAHEKLQKWLENRAKMAEGETPLDWSSAEALAFAALATEGHRIRLTGQDSERGTFSQRHATLHDADDGHDYCPFQHLSPTQAPVEICNSPLSEAGVLGFEYGYSIAYPEALVAWEAQFGDFANAAQVIIDQFITSAEDKWRSLSGLTLLLPHGFEGQGPEHSSARMERFLVLGAEDNIQVTYPTTPAQYFHLLRRQVLRPWRKPLVVFTPKSLLRLSDCTSALEYFESGTFQRIIPERRPHDPDTIDRILMCTGKIYYDLERKRQELGLDNVVILRMEQLYPLPKEILQDILLRYREETPVYWVQEEPRNMGAWSYIEYKLGRRLFERHPLTGVCRPASASPATGSHSSHQLEQKRLLKKAFKGLVSE